MSSIPSPLIPSANLAIYGNSAGTGYSAGAHWSELHTRR